MSDAFVALDLETTGFDPQNDAIIEIGAVRFNHEGVVDRFVSFVNPHRAIPEAVRALTGISDEDVGGAPILEVIASDLETFLGDCPLVGHNITGFDLPFLDAKGVRHGDLVFDTAELATMLLPGQPEYNLRFLAALFEVPLTSPHRALPDATAAMGVFQALRRRAASLTSGLLAQVDAWLSATRWPGRLFFREALDEARAAGGVPDLAAGAARPEALPNFEERPEQKAMVAAVTEALNEGERLIVEAGTGTGKSLAYLIPAALYALANGRRVVLSTNTINLQEQLQGKDIPALRALLDAGETDGGPLRTAVLKGRRNYLCLRRLAAMQPGAAAVSDDEAKMIARLLIWLTETDTGDRAELRLYDREEAIWRRFSAEESQCTADNCPFVQDGTCFLLRARRRAEAAHIVVVNHALLLSDVTSGGHIIPPYEDLVIDEAHHLEDEATRQLGFSAREGDVEELLERCQRLAQEARTSARRIAAPLGPGGELVGMAAALVQSVERARPRLRELAEAARSFLRQHAPDPAEYDYRLLINRSMRVQPDWPGVEVAWDNLRLPLTQVADLLGRLQESLAGADVPLVNQELLTAETAGLQAAVKGLVEGVAAAVEEDDPQRIVWFEEDRQRGNLSVSWAPLEVGELLQARLYEGKNSVVFTGATLATGP
ncbi:MAG: DEAD/DEAH box helicase family protein, partial [Chloroflexi bacterium]|nr:DEAD/DEAH box helicase family protein [Chloroflexota bacterium]